MDRLTEALHFAEEAVQQEPARTSDSTARAVSLAALLFMPSDVIALNLGNISSYRISAAGTLRVNRNHSMFDGAEGQGGLPPQEIRPRHAVTRALGIGSSPQPDVTRHAYQPGDRFLLSTWGVWATVGHQDLCSTVAAARDADDASRSLAAFIPPGTAGALVVAEVLQPTDRATRDRPSGE